MEGKSLALPYCFILSDINFLRSLSASLSDGFQYRSNFLYHLLLGRIFSTSNLLLKTLKIFFNFFKLLLFDGIFSI